MVTTESRKASENPSLEGSGSGLSRRTVVGIAGALGLATPFAVFGRASALIGMGARACSGPVES
jgi:hypothetical protein